MRWLAMAAIVAAAMVAAGSGAAGRDTPPSLPDRAQVAALAAQTMRDTGARGLAIALVDRGRLVSAQAFGTRNAAGAPLTPDTVMYGASLTKAVFGYYVAGLAQQRVIDLDRPIAALLPRPLPAYGNPEKYGHWGDLAGDERWRRITPRNALNHATGFANFWFLEPDERLRIHFDPGSRYAYSGEGLVLLQFALEQGLGRSVGDEVAAQVLTLAGATSTSLIWQPRFAANLADGWDEKGAAHPHDERSEVRVAGSMDTTITDMGRIAAYMVRGGGLDRRWRAAFARGTRPITTASQFPTLQPEAPAAQRPHASAAMGVIAFDGPQGPGWYKGGHDDITANTMVCLERSRRCVVILSNDVRAEAAFPRLVRALIGDTGVPYRWEYPGLAAY